MRFQQTPHRQTSVQAIGQISVSAQLQLNLAASISLSLCIGFLCGGVSANARWEAAAGFDVGLTTSGDSDMPGRGLDADGVGCREYTFESKLTNYAEYPPCAGVSVSAPHPRTRSAPPSRQRREALGVCTL